MTQDKKIFLSKADISKNVYNKDELCIVNFIYPINETISTRQQSKMHHLFPMERSSLHSQIFVLDES